MYQDNGHYYEDPQVAQDVRYEEPIKELKVMTIINNLVEEMKEMEILPAQQALYLAEGITYQTGADYTESQLAMPVDKLASREIALTSRLLDECDITEPCGQCQNCQELAYNAGFQSLK